ncbi:hypothetical protein Salat_2118000 [Sesamum alatum]|uniref:Uncharacterized protein n=1 Tax=Sesamum alatum TaxID=300844 RepID=A0AAE1Y115_9LAMI|nr:hypothetical protein Salat_2118000 [Sesamum alatum]
MRVRPFGHIRPEPTLTDEELTKAHWFILSNCEEVEHYMKIYKAELLGIAIEEASDLNMNLLHHQKVAEVTEELWSLANGPFKLNTKCYSGCMVNEVRFHTREREARRRTQNSGEFHVDEDEETDNEDNYISDDIDEDDEENIDDDKDSTELDESDDDD